MLSGCLDELSSVLRPLHLSAAFIFFLCLPRSPSSGLCISIHPCMEIDWRHEYITTSHPCILPLFLPQPPPPISPRSLSQHLSQSSDLMHFNRHVYPPPPPPPSFFPLTLDQWHPSNKQQQQNCPPPPLPRFKSIFAISE